MSIFQVIVLAIVQGLTEFLPVSSSAHLALAPWLFGWPDQGLTFDIALHFGTLMAVLVYFFRDWIQVIAQALGINYAPDRELRLNRSLLWFLVLATIPFWKKRAVEVPIYQGRPLTYWAEQHPTNYYEACRALGTNALPYLLSELEARDPAPRVLLQKIASSILPIGEVFTRAGHRKYYAQLGLQQLDTNALPTLLDLFITLTSQDSSSSGGKPCNCSCQ